MISENAALATTEPNLRKVLVTATKLGHRNESRPWKMMAVATRRPAYVMKRVLEMVKILLAASSVMQTPSCDKGR